MIETIAILLNRLWQVIKTIPVEIQSALVSGIFLLLTAIAAYRWGLKTYFKQRQHEQILKRYLAEGIDLISQRVEQVHSTFLNNYAKATNILGRIEVLKEADFMSNFIGIESHTGCIPLEKLKYLMGDDTLAIAILELFFFVESSTNYLNTHFLPEALDFWRKLQSHDNDNTWRQMFTNFIERLEYNLKDDAEIMFKYSFVQDNLRAIASILEKETNLTWSALNDLKNRSEIKERIEVAKKKLDDIRKAISSRNKQKGSYF